MKKEKNKEINALFVNKNVYGITSFDTKTRRLSFIIRKTEKEAIEQIKEEVATTSYDKDKEKFDYTDENHPILGRNEHNAYCVDAEGTEWFWQTECISLYGIGDLL